MRFEEEEEEESLITEGAKVVEHLEPIMSQELLCKFSDNSTFDFDYNQSSIWSPLVPRLHIPIDSITPRKLSYDFGPLANKNKKSISAQKKKMMMKKTAASLNVFKKKASQFSTANVKASCAPIATKGWSKMLKAASKHFKKQKKKKDASGHVRLSNYFK